MALTLSTCFALCVFQLLQTKELAQQRNGRITLHALTRDGVCSSSLLVPPRGRTAFYNPGLMRWDEAERTASATQRVLEPPSQWGDGAAGGRSRATGTSLCLLVKEPPRGRSQSQGLEKPTACSRSSRSQQTPRALPSWHTQAPRSRLSSQVKQFGGHSERLRSKHGSK